MAETHESGEALKDALAALAVRHGLRIVYSFGSRAREALGNVLGSGDESGPQGSDLDIGVMPGWPLSVVEKVDLATALEELFRVPLVDLVTLPDADPFLALEIVKGELLYAADETFEAEYQLYVMRRADEFRHYREETLKQTLGF